jgi:hypothetical protein
MQLSYELTELGTLLRSAHHRSPQVIRVAAHNARHHALDLRDAETCEIWGGVCARRSVGVLLAKARCAWVYSAAEDIALAAEQRKLLPSVYGTFSPWWSASSTSALSRGRVLFVKVASWRTGAES